MFVVNSFSQLEEAARVGAKEILIHGRLAVSLRRRMDNSLKDDGQRPTFDIEKVEYEAVDNRYHQQSLHLLLCRSQHLT